MKQRGICIGVIALTLVFGCLPFCSAAQREEYIKVRVGADFRSFDPNKQVSFNAPSIPELEPYLSPIYNTFPVVYFGKRLQREHDFEYGCSIGYSKARLVSQIESLGYYNGGYWIRGDAEQKTFRSSFYAESWRDGNSDWRHFGFGSELFTGTMRFDGNFLEGRSKQLQIDALWYYIALEYRVLGELYFGHENQLGFMGFIGWHYGWQRLLKAKLSNEPIPEVDRQGFAFTGVTFGAVMTYAWPHRK